VARIAAGTRTLKRAYDTGLGLSEGGDVSVWAYRFDWKRSRGELENLSNSASSSILTWTIRHVVRLAVFFECFRCKNT
jgi:hypothetical protein